VLRDVDVTAQAGQVLAIVGPTGVGKTTLVGLVGRFYDPVGGRVLLDGVDLREYRLRELRGRIAMVLQPALVFPTTLRENIAYGRSTASDEEVARAAHLAQLDGFLARLPEGLDTVVGEQGATVSDGERQRITIARAILRDAPILILDEPTSALDAETEALIIAALRELMRGRTTFVIAHRLSTVRHADQIIVLRDGKVAESGTFDELVGRGGAFTRLYQAQFGAPPPREAAG
jgi:ATP-binding cassette subfamily B protein/subfamily B ATP-binding cassette protein MsbA